MIKLPKHKKKVNSILCTAETKETDVKLTSNDVGAGPYLSVMTEQKERCI